VIDLENEPDIGILIGNALFWFLLIGMSWVHLRLAKNLVLGPIFFVLSSFSALLVCIGIFVHVVFPEREPLLYVAPLVVLTWWVIVLRASFVRSSNL